MTEGFFSFPLYSEGKAEKTAVMKHEKLGFSKSSIFINHVLKIMHMQEDVKVWLEQAKADLKAAEKNIDINELKVAAFLSQQATEKALKALYIKKFKKLLKTHDLVLLARKMDMPEDLINKCKNLSPAYIYTRYPDAIEIRELGDVISELITHAKEVLQWVEKRL